MKIMTSNFDYKNRGRIGEAQNTGPVLENKCACGKPRLKITSLDHYCAFVDPSSCSLCLL